METKFYTIPGRLQKCTQSDILSKTGEFVENTLFFIKNIETLEFYGTYKIKNVNTLFQNEESIKNKMYYVKEVGILLKNQLLYKLVSDDSNTELHFKMYVRTANEFDLYEGASFLAFGTIYYVKNNDTIEGPFYLNKYTNVDSIKDKIEQEAIFVPYKKQKFEPIEIKKIA